MPSEAVSVAATTTAAGAVRSRTADRRIFGTLILTFGGGWLLQSLGIALPWEAIVAAVLLALGIGMMATPRGGPGVRLWVLGIVLTLGLASMSSVATAFPGGGIGDKTIQITSVDQLRHYEQLGGQYTVDLTTLVVPPGEHHRVDLELGAGRLVVLVPRNVTVHLSARVTGGDVWMFGKQRAAGVLQDAPVLGPADDATSAWDLEVHAKVSFGEVIVAHDQSEVPTDRNSWHNGKSGA